MTDVPPDTSGENEDWLVDPQHPALSSPGADRIADGNYPDRLTWNAFQTLAEWDTDVWVPRLIEIALGGDLPIVEMEWGDATVELWKTGATGPNTDVVI